ncbi:MAG: S8 family serine peptidase, partial [Candidatus Krumholzibacteriota bacterium]|nr:S8 family serine peptidase [Candidatus Krumholzibacteriota bacterium]
MRRSIICAGLAAAILALPVGMRGDENRLRQLSRDLLEQSRGARETALRAASSRGLAVAGVDAGGREFSLQALGPGEIPVYYITENVDAAATTRTDEVHGAIGGGTGFVFGIWDAGKIGITHEDFRRPDLSTRVSWEDAGNPDISIHSTHVAGTLIGDGSSNALALGMAWDAELAAYCNDDDIAEMAAEAAGGMVLSNHSYGHIQGWYYGDLHDDGVTEYNWYWYGNTLVSGVEDYRFGSYSDISAQVDSIAGEAPDYLMVCSAGNHRWENVPYPGCLHYVWNQGLGYWQWSSATREMDGGIDGYDCLGDGWKTAKNGLTVGMVADLEEYTGPGSVSMMDYSSWGPTDDGRIKPDLVGNGDDVYSAIGLHDGHDRLTGTSMASANVAGSLALLEDWYVDNHGGPMRAATLKALALCTAREAGTYDGPDYRFGWGLFDAKAAYDLLLADLDGGRGIVRELTLDEGTPIVMHYRATAAQPRATICWNDPPGSPTGIALNPTVPQLVNDVELMLERGGAFHYPWILDPFNPDAGALRAANHRDNVERVDVDGAGIGDRYALWIWNNGLLAGGSQDVSLVVSGLALVTTWFVDDDGGADFETIQGALNVAAAGDTIVVMPGFYDEHDLVVDRSLVVTAPGGPGETSVDAGGLGRCFRVESEADAVTIEGFTLTGGSADGAGEAGYGGALFCASPSARIADCRILSCEAALRGGGLYLAGGASEIDACTIEDCRSAAGGGIYAYYGAPHIHDAAIAGCAAGSVGGGLCLYHAGADIEYVLLDADSAAASGGGIAVYGASPGISRCTIVSCHAPNGGGIFAGTDAYPAVANAIVALSTAGEGICGAAGVSGATVSCSDVWGNAGGGYGGSVTDRTGIDGNIAADPLFCDAAGGNLGLQGISPCLPANNACGELMGLFGQACHSRSLWYVTVAGTGDAPTIQAAIDSAFAGDTVLVAAGTYTGAGNRDVEFRGKGLLVLSESGRDLTIVDCESAPGDNHAGFLFVAGEDSASVLDGFTVTRASLAGVRGDGASPVVRHCRFVDNDETDYFGPGGGMRFEWGSPAVRWCVVEDNECNSGAGGISAVNAELLLEHCTIEANTGADWGGVGLAGGAARESTIRDCTLAENAGGVWGGGVFAGTDHHLVVEDSRITGNHAELGGGGVMAGGGLAISNTVVAGNAVALEGTSWGGGLRVSGASTISNCTIVSNESAFAGSGIHIGPVGTDDPVVVEKTIVAFNGGGGCGICVDGEVGGWDVTVACSDVFGNAGGEYAGDLEDQTGLDDNFSEAPLFCDTLAGDFHLFDDSPCAPAHAPCGELVGALAVDCEEAPDLVVTALFADGTHLDPGEEILFTVTVRNDGIGAADTFAIGFYRDRSTAPMIRSTATLDTLVAGLAAGDSVTWTAGPMTSADFGVWESWFLADANGAVREGDEENNAAGPVTVTWGVPGEPGWPAAGFAPVRTAPALANIDDDPATLETIVGDDGGLLHAIRADGGPLSGWPVSLGDSIVAAPAVGNVVGDWRPEVVVGTVDGFLHLVESDGTVVRYIKTYIRIGNAVTLADLDDDGLCEIILPQYEEGGECRLRVFKGSGEEWTAGWTEPVYKVNGGITEAAVGDVDNDGDLEIAVVTWGYTSPGIHSRLDLLSHDGSVYGAGWPATIDTVVVAPPVIGEISAAAAGLEIVVGALSGEVFAVDPSGAFVWPTAPRVPGMIETSPIMVQGDKDEQQEVAVTSSWWQSAPPFGYWTGRVSLVDDDGSVPPGMQVSVGSWSLASGPVPSPISFDESFSAAGPRYRVYSWWFRNGDGLEAFPLSMAGNIRAAMAAGDIDGD